MAFATRIRSITAAQILVLCLLFAAEAPGTSFIFVADPEAESAVVRVNFITEIQGAKDAVEINGRIISDYSPVIIEVFSSTGISLDDKGHIMTFLGYHWLDVAGRDSRIEVAAGGGQKWKGKLIGIDQSNGVSVVRLVGGKLKKTPVCVKCEIKDGATVMAPLIGRQGPQFQEAQILSVGAGRGIAGQGPWTMKMNRPFPDVGLPVLTADGRILGFVASQDPRGFRTVVYPISQLLASAEKILRSGGDIRAGWLGVFLNDSSQATEPGIAVQGVEPESPAQKAGLAAGDLLLKYDGRQITDARQFIQLVQNTPVGSSVPLEILRQGQAMTVTSSIEARRPQPVQRRIAFNFPHNAVMLPSPDVPDPKPRVGLDTVLLTPPLADALQMPGQTGLLIVDVAKQLPADRAGVLAGDVIVAVDGRPILDAPGFASYLQGRDWNRALELKIIRKGVERNITVQLPNQDK
jgi:S1-C subfamily serine protease